MTLVSPGSTTRRVSALVHASGGRHSAVRYRLTELGLSLETPLSALRVWAETHMPSAICRIASGVAEPSCFPAIAMAGTVIRESRSRTSRRAMARQAAAHSSDRSRRARTRA